MSIDSINNYGTGTTGGTTKKSDNSTLDMDDFFQLMVAQLSNQDMYNTMDNSQFIAQMAQFSMVQALADLSQASATSYSVSLIGKEVTLAETGSDGKLKTHTGIVDGVTLYNGSAQIIVDDIAYPISSVMQVKEPNIIIPTDPTAKKTADDTETIDETKTVDETNTGDAGGEGDGDV